MKIDFTRYADGQTHLKAKAQDQELGKAIKIILDQALPPALFALNQLVQQIACLRREIEELSEPLKRIAANYPELEEDE